MIEETAVNQENQLLATILWRMVLRKDIGLQRGFVVACLRVTFIGEQPTIGKYLWSVDVRFMYFALYY